MDPIQHLKGFLGQVVPLSEDDFDLVIPYWKVEEYSKGEHLFNAGSICKDLWFVHDGLLRQYENRDGNEATIHFTDKTDFLTLFESLYPQVPCDVSVQALEPTVVLTLPYYRLQEAYLKSHMVERVGRMMVERAFIQFVEQVRRFNVQSPAERLEELEVNYPEIARRVPQKILASYLGIQPESLSRIRKRRVRPSNN